MAVGLLPPRTSVNSGSGVVRVCASTVAGDAGDAGDAVVAVGAGDGVAAADAVGRGAAGAVPVGRGRGEAVAATDTVDADAGSARAGESVAAVSEVKVTTNAVKSAVVFRIEFTFCLS